MNSTKPRITAGIILGKLLSIIGYGWIGFWTIGLIVGLSDAELKYQGIYFIIVVFMMLLGLILIIPGLKIKRRIKRFRNYVALISAKRLTSLDLIANSMNQSVDFVRKDIQKMIDSKYFKDAYINRDTNEIIIAHAYSQAADRPQSAVEMQSVTCSGCGAANTKPKSEAANCEYCGSPL